MISVFGDFQIECEDFLNTTCGDKEATVIVTKGTPQTYGDTELIEIQYRTLIDLSHELVHARQILEGTLSDAIMQKMRGAPYEELPWEVEAYALERSVYEKVFNASNNTVNNNIT